MPAPLIRILAKAFVIGSLEVGPPSAFRVFFQNGYVRNRNA